MFMAFPGYSFLVCDGERGNSTTTPLGSRKEDFGQFRAEAVEFLCTFGGRFELVFLRDEIMAVTLQHFGAEISADEISWLPEYSESARTLGGEKSGAVPFAHAHIAFIHWKRDDLEVMRTKTVENRRLLSRDLHRKTE
jgi:hypothetical protein